LRTAERKRNREHKEKGNNDKPNAEEKRENKYKNRNGRYETNRK
jgi:hypothetical protein